MHFSPAFGFQGRDEGIIDGEQGVGKVPPAEIFLPVGPDLNDTGIAFQEVGAIEVTATVEENFALSGKTVDQVTAELVGREDSGCGGQLRHARGGFHRELVGRETGRQPGSSPAQEGSQRQRSQPGAASVEYP